MKTKLFSLFLALIISCGGTLLAWNYEQVQIGDLYYNLNSINMTAEVTSMPTGTYKGNITIPPSISFNSITYDVKSIGFAAFNVCTDLTDITIPNSITTIEDGAFDWCVSLTSITIPSSVISIGHLVLAHCIGLTNIVVENGNTTYDSRNNCNAIIETASNKLIAGCKNTIIPNTIASIEIAAFLYCHYLTNIEIPSSVNNIGESAFANCKNLSLITNYATTPQNINYDDEEGVFEGEEGEALGIMFGPVDKSKCKLYVPKESIGLYKVAEGWKEFKNILPISASAIDLIEENQNIEFKKYISKGQIFISRGSNTYTLQGAEVK